MPAIAKNNDVITVIIIFAVEPERQQELIDTIVEFLETTVKQQPGFVSSSIHKSLDGVRVMNYAQWKTQEDYQAFINNSEVQAKGAKLSQFELLDSHIFEVVISKPDNHSPKITKGGFLTHLAEFRMKPENQQAMLHLAKKEIVTAVQQNPGLISATFHRSFDGTRVMNYGQWRSQEDFEAILKKPDFEIESGYWVGLAENEFHVYEVVYTQPTD
ncbi:antibiotic biosynthesis monooxygenase family protein [Scytonema sp. PCC 10023]|uniref:antibiotic biosynthesis monooxygenase family protein n=1 Tax=Scytonema sp. PCC 10023 TaxID=1680591 RepID=UPI0039C67643